MNKLLTFILIYYISALLSNSGLLSQNVAITDDSGYTPDPSAMLDVMSTTKGMLVPRVSTGERTSILSPATGLMVFDTDINCFYFYTGSGWTHVSSGSNTQDIWGRTGSNVYLNTITDKVGIGTTSPTSPLVVYQPSTGAAGDTLFQVKDNSGNTVFAVFPEGVRVYVDEGVKGSVGGFAVTGRNSSKAETGEYLWVSPDSVRIYIKEDPMGGSVGGFAVTGRNSSKGLPTNQYLRVSKDSTRIWTNNPNKGFGVSDLNTGSIKSYMRLTPNNYFIGHLSGQKNAGGVYNSYLGFQTGLNNQTGGFNTFFGYQAGKDNTSSDNTFIGFQAGMSHVNGGGNVYIGSKAGQDDLNGAQNIFIGEYAGYQNGGGSQNVFIGLQSGYSNLSGSHNVFLGYNSGYTNTTGLYNAYIGYESGYLSTTGSSNVFLGYRSGYANKGGSFNVYMGYESGRDNIAGASNVFIGYNAGMSNTDGWYNNFIGESAGKSNTTGTNNIFIGQGAGQLSQTPSGNIFIGKNSGYSNNTGYANLFIGNFSGEDNNDGANNIFLGYDAGANHAFNHNNVFIGTASGYNNINGRDNTFIGSRAGRDASGSYNIFIGIDAGRNETGNDKLYIDNSSTSTPLIYGDFSSNRVGFNVDNPSETIDVSGSARFRTVGSLAFANDLRITVNGTLTTNTSDKRLKTNITPLSSGLEKVLKMNAYTFNWISEPNGQKDVGFIAQDMLEIFPEAVFQNPNDGYYGINYSRFPPILVEAIKEQQKQIESLKNECNLLKKEIEKLTTEVNTLKK